MNEPTAEKAAPKRGRKIIAATGERASEYFAMRMTPTQREKLETLGGAQWIRGRIDAAKLAKEKK